jgi:hypothetical protein
VKLIGGSAAIRFSQGHCTADSVVANGLSWE